MKFKVAIAVLLALVMLGTLAVPALADTSRGRLTVHLGDETKAMGRVVLTTYEGNMMWAEITAKKLQPGAMYCWTIDGSDLLSPVTPVSGVADERGNWGGGAMLGPFDAGDAWFTFTLSRGSVGSANGVATEPIYVTFP